MCTGIFQLFFFFFNKGNYSLVVKSSIIIHFRIEMFLNFQKQTELPLTIKAAV